MNTVAKFDFGNSSVPPQKGYIKVERVYTSPRFMWVEEMKNAWRTPDAPSPVKDFLYGSKGEFRVGLPADTYTIRLLFCDEKQSWDKFRVFVRSVDGKKARGEGKTLCEFEMEVPADELVIKEVTVHHEGKGLAVDFQGIDGGMYMVSGMEILCEREHSMEVLIPESPSDILPLVEEVMEKGETNPVEALHRICRWMIAHQTPDGFLGDYDFSQRLWYTTSYPLRTFMAAYKLTGEEEYLDMATGLIDLFVGEQMPECSFTQSYRQKPTKDTSEEELDQIRRKNWMNLADIGSMVAALVTACQYVTGERKERYIRSARGYLDNWAARYRRPNGGYVNGWICREAEWIYSVSTATTALSLALFYRVTGEEKYLRLAEESALFMVSGWSEKGPYMNWPFDNTYPGHPCLQAATEFGDLFYSLESLSAVMSITNSHEVRKAIFDAFHKYLFGEEGALNAKKGLPWWPIDNYWHMSKSAGMPIILYDFIQYADEMKAEPEEVKRAKEEYETCCKYLCTPAYSKAIGVCADYYEGEAPFRNTSVLSWTGCAVAATGFAGIAVAQMVKPGLIYLNESNC